MAACLWLLSGCGFHAVYGDGARGAGSAVRGNVIIDPMPGREGQIFKTALEDIFNPQGVGTQNAQYRLHVTMSKLLIPAVVKSDSTIQRYNVRFDTQFTLSNTGDSKALFTGRLLRTGSYNVAVNANFASYEAEQDVIERTLQEMAEDYLLRVEDDLAAAETPAKK